MDVKLLIDKEEIDLNEFVAKVLAGMVVGAVGTLRGYRKEWKQIAITISK